MVPIVVSYKWAKWLTNPRNLGVPQAWTKPKWLHRPYLTATNFGAYKVGRQHKCLHWPAMQSGDLRLCKFDIPQARTKSM